MRETRRQVLGFYSDVVQDLKAWQPRPPKLPDPPAEVPKTAEPEPPPFAAVDERDLGEGVAPRDAPGEDSQSVLGNLRGPAGRP